VDEKEEEIQKTDAVEKIEPKVQDHFELFKKKKEAEVQCEALLKDLKALESNQELYDLLKEQQK
jgi:hypothetical protein